MVWLKNDGASEQQYLDLVREILDHGIDRGDRTNTGTRAIHGATLRIDLSDGTLPLPTTKFVDWTKPFKELMWMLSGETNIRPLLLEDVHIWTEWPYARYAKSTPEASSMTQKSFEARIVADEAFAAQWGDLGPVYGKQWRRWAGPDGREYDQIQDLLHQIKHNPNSRRLLFSGWNVADVERMALPPCHLLYQFFVAEGRLSLTMYQRSCDTALGLPFNLVSCAFLLRMLAQQCDLEPGSLFWVGHDVHLYANHLDIVTTQLENRPKPAPRLRFKRRPDSLFEYTVDDVIVEGYEPGPVIRFPIAV